MNKMSDDLISRKAFMEYLGLEDTEENREENVGEIVTLEDFDRQATAFDKEKVIEQLDGCRVYQFQGMLPDGRVCHFSDVIEIVERGGVE